MLKFAFLTYLPTGTSCVQDSLFKPQQFAFMANLSSKFLPHISAVFMAQINSTWILKLIAVFTESNINLVTLPTDVVPESADLVLYFLLYTPNN